MALAHIYSKLVNPFIKVRYVEGCYLKSTNKRDTKTRLVSDLVLGTRFPISRNDLDLMIWADIVFIPVSERSVEAPLLVIDKTIADFDVT